MTALDGTQGQASVETVCGCICPDCRTINCCNGIYCNPSKSELIAQLAEAGRYLQR